MLKNKTKKIVNKKLQISNEIEKGINHFFSSFLE